MPSKKTLITTSIDPDILKRIDRVCEARAESRSAYVQRALKNSLPDEEKYLEEMESPLMRGLYKVLGSQQGLTVLAKLFRDQLSEDEIARIAMTASKDTERGQQRASAKKGKRKYKEATT